jgi:hypothetical protein
MKISLIFELWTDRQTLQCQRVHFLNFLMDAPRKCYIAFHIMNIFMKVHEWALLSIINLVWIFWESNYVIKLIYYSDILLVIMICVWTSKFCLTSWAHYISHSKGMGVDGNHTYLKFGKGLVFRGLITALCDSVLKITTDHLCDVCCNVLSWSNLWYQDKHLVFWIMKFSWYFKI